MPDWGSLTAFLALGLLGSAHCVGMCGGFAVAAAASGGAARRRALTRGLVYVLGKALTYALLGLLAARVAALFAHEGAHALGEGAAGRAAVFEDVRRSLAWVAGALMAGFGLALLLRRGLPRFGALPEPLRRGATAARALFAGARQLPGHAGALGTGLLTGLLPCGLSWSAFALAATLDPGPAALGSFLFGLATAPALLLVGLGWHAFSVRSRRLATRAAAPLLILFGLLTVVRGGLPQPLRAGERVLPACCRDGASSTDAGADHAPEGSTP